MYSFNIKITDKNFVHEENQNFETKKELFST